VALSKCDAISEEDVAACHAALAEHVDGDVRTVSAVARMNLVETLRELRLVIRDAREVEAESEAAATALDLPEHDEEDAVSESIS
jgi:GTPase involved in cell partitioning and DNA repair